MATSDPQSVAQTSTEPITIGDELERWLTAEGEKTTRAIAEQVRTLGLQPWRAPEPLPAIDEDEVVLVVWMAVDAIA